MKYTELKKEQQKKINDFPMIFACTDQQLQEKMQELGIKSKNELISLGAGSILQKKDKQDFENLFISIEKEMKQFLASDKNLEDALFYELDNHEFGITGDHHGAFMALGLKFNDKRALRVFGQVRMNY